MNVILHVYDVDDTVAARGFTTVPSTDRPRIGLEGDVAVQPRVYGGRWRHGRQPDDGRGPSAHGDGMTHTTAIAELPAPSSTHATCAWCREHFDTITDLIDHVDAGHAGPTLRTAA